jgi:hypothetical protein
MNRCGSSVSPRFSTQRLPLESVASRVALLAAATATKSGGSESDAIRRRNARYRRGATVLPLHCSGAVERLREQPSMPEHVIDRRLAFAGFNGLLEDDGGVVVDRACDRRRRVLDLEQDSS